MVAIKTTSVRDKEEEDEELFMVSRLGGKSGTGNNDEYDDDDNDNDDDDGDEDRQEASHAQLLSDMMKLTKKKKMQQQVRTSLSTSTTLDTSHLLSRLGPSTGMKKDRHTHTLPLPVEKTLARRIKRAAGYENVAMEANKWAKLVKTRREADQLHFPLERNDLSIKTQEKADVVQLKTPLEQEVYSLLQGAKLIKPKKETEEEEIARKALSLQEIREKNREMWRQKEMKRRYEQKARLMNKSKSRKYHRLLRRERLKKQRAELEELQKTDPEAALERLQELEAVRIEERMSLRHKTSKWAHLQGFRATRDKNAMAALRENQRMHEQLTTKTTKPQESEGEEELSDDAEITAKDEEVESAVRGMEESQNPWLRHLQRSQPPKDTGGDPSFTKFKKFWEEVNRKKKADQEIEERMEREKEEEKNMEDGKLEEENGGEEEYKEEEEEEEDEEKEEEEEEDEEEEMGEEEEEEEKDSNKNRNKRKKKIEKQIQEEDEDEEEEEEEQDASKIKNKKGKKDTQKETQEEEEEDNNKKKNKRKRKKGKQKQTQDREEEINTGKERQKQSKDEPQDKTEPDDGGENNKNNKSKKRRRNKKKIKTQETAEQEALSIDKLFDEVETGIKNKVMKKLKKMGVNTEEQWKEVKGKRKKGATTTTNNATAEIEEFDFTSTRDQENTDEGLNRAKTLQDMESIEGKTENNLQKAVKVLKGSSAANPSGAATPNKRKLQVDPNNFLQVDAKKLVTDLPDGVGEAGEALDDEEGNEETAEDIIREAFADDYLMEEFSTEKSEAIKKDQVSMSLALPGWGDWTGPNIKMSNNKIKKFRLRVPHAARKDSQLGNVLYNESADIHSKLRKAMVTELPYPFKSVKDFEASVRAPLGQQFMPVSAHKRLTAPPIVTKIGTVIQPMTEDELLRHQETHKGRREDRLSGGARGGRKRKNNTPRRTNNKKSKQEV